MSKILWSSAKESLGKTQYIKKYAVGKTLLDVGCAQGWYADFAKKRGFKVLGTDISNFLEVRIPFKKIKPGQLAPTLNQTFDTVLMFDVLEHIENEKKALQDLAKICNKRVIISVPYENDLNLSDYHLTLANRKDLTHQRYYTPESLSKKLQTVGFQVIHCQLDGAVLPGLVGEFIRPPSLGKIATSFLNKLLFAGILKSPYFGDVYLIAEKKDSP